jgi:tetratricopeptide (TPR) repeat protein
MTPEVAHLIREGLEAMYGCDYNTAEQKFDSLVRLYPEHPAGYMYKAECVWWKCLRNTTSKELQNQFTQYSETGVARGLALVQRDPKDFYAQMFLAGIYGNQTRFYVTITHSTVAAMRSGMKGDKYNQNSLALRPDCVDCLIGTGSHDYAPEVLPSLLKGVAKLMGIRADKSRSLENLELAAEKGEFAQTEAKIVLLGIYYNEKWFDKYEKLLMQLINQYPSNHVFTMWLAIFYQEQHRVDEGIECISRLLEKASRNPVFRLAQEYAYLEKGRLELGKKALNDAVHSLSRGIDAGRGNPDYLAQAHMLRGFALDLLSHRESAIQEYRSVLALPNVEDSHKSASRFTRSPFQGRM